MEEIHTSGHPEESIFAVDSRPMGVPKLGDDEAGVHTMFRRLVHSLDPELSMIRAFLKRQSSRAGFPVAALTCPAGLVAVLFLVAALAVRAPAESNPPPPTPAAPPASATSPRPTATPNRIVIRTVDKQGRESEQTIDFQGPISGDFEEFRRQQRAISPPASKTPTPASVTPTPAKSVRTSVNRSRPAPLPGPGNRLSLGDRFTTPSAFDDLAASRMYRSAQMLFNQGKIEEGRRHLSLLFRVHPSTRWAAEGHVAWGRQAEARGDWSEAVEHLDDPGIQALAPKRRAQAALAAGDALAMLDRYADARIRAAAALESATAAGDRILQREARTLSARLELLGLPAPPPRVAAVIQQPEFPLFPLPNSPSTASGQASAPPPLDLPIPAGSVVWLDFFQTNCPHCEKAYPQVKPQSEEAVANGVAVAWIGYDDIADPKSPPDLEPYRAYIRRYPRPGLVAVDFAHITAFEMFQGRGSPWTVLIDRESIVRYCDVYNEIKVRDKLTQLLSE